MYLSYPCGFPQEGLNEANALTVLGGKPSMSVQLDNESQPEGQTVSIRKIEANRRNALKSTGPKTSRGKTYSRRNALKHGLFAMDTTDLILQFEDPEEYRKLLEGL